MQRREFLAIPPALAGLGLSGCSAPSDTGSVRSLSVSLSDRLSSSPAFLAEERGFFRDAGYELDIVRLSTIQGIPLLAGGKLDVGFGGLSSPLINAVARGMNIRIVCGREQVNPDCGNTYTLYARREVFEGGPVDVEKLRGRRFSVRVAGITELVLDTFLDQTGIPEDQVERVDLQLNESLAALASGQIDAMFDIEFESSPLAASPEIVRVWRLADVYPNHQYSFIVFGDSMLSGDPMDGARFLAAYLKGGEEFLAGETPEFMREFARNNNLDMDETVFGCRETFAADGAIDLPSLQRIIDWNVRKGYATDPMDASQLVDSSYVDQARLLLAEDNWRVRHGTAVGSSL